MKFVYYLVWNFIQAISMLHTTPLPTPAVQNAGLMLLCDWLIWVTKKGEGLQRQPMQKKHNKILWPEPANRHLAGISQSEDAALETWNRLNEMKWTKKSKNDYGKKKINEIWEKWKMERTERWELQVKTQMAIKWLQ